MQNRSKNVKPATSSTARLPTAILLTLCFGVCAAIKVQPFSFPPDLLEGSRVIATCSLLRVSEGTRFRWLKDGKALDADSHGRIRTRTDVDFSMITIDPAHQEDSGNYSCTATSKGKSDTHTAHLAVYATPKWTHRPTDVLITEGNNVSTICTASGNPVPTVTLRKDGGNENSKFQGKGTATLHITKSTKMDAGTYSCIASNGFGASIQQSFLVKVYGEKTEM